MAESNPKPRIENPWLRALVDITGGTAGGVGLVLVGHPFDTLKVRLQTQSQTNPMYGGLGDCVAKTWKNEGFGGFYRGWQSPLYGQMIFNAVQFCAYGLAKDFVTKFGSSNNNNNNKNSKDDKAPMTMGQILGAAAMTGFTIAFVEGPIDLFKTQLQTQIFKEKPLYSTFGGCVSHIIKNYGWRGAFQGITPTIARNVPAVTAYFGFYEYAKESFAKQQNTTVDNLPPLSVLTAGATGGFGYWIATYPIDVIKSTMQMDNPDKSQRKYTSIGKTASILYKEGGVKRFFVGISPCLMRAAPANAVCFFFYEATVASFNKQFGK